MQIAANVRLRRRVHHSRHYESVCITPFTQLNFQYGLLLVDRKEFAIVVVNYTDSRLARYGVIKLLFWFSINPHVEKMASTGTLDAM